MDTTTLAETSDYLDGPRLVAWIKTEKGWADISHLEDRLGFHARAFRAWRTGRRAHLPTAEVVLHKLNLDIGMVTDDVWAADQTICRVETTEGQREAIERIVFTEGRSPTVAAAEIDCGISAVRHHMQRFQKELTSAA